MSYFLKESDLALLKETGLSEPDIAHCVKVAEIALDIAQRTDSNLTSSSLGGGRSSTISEKHKPMTSSTGRSGRNWEPVSAFPKRFSTSWRSTSGAASPPMKRLSWGFPSRTTRFGPSKSESSSTQTGWWTSSRTEAYCLQ